MLERGWGAGGGGRGGGGSRMRGGDLSQWLRCTVQRLWCG